MRPTARLIVVLSALTAAALPQAASAAEPGEFVLSNAAGPVHISQGSGISDLITVTRVPGSTAIRIALSNYTQGPYSPLNSTRFTVGGSCYVTEATQHPQLAGRLLAATLTCGRGERLVAELGDGTDTINLAASFKNGSRVDLGEGSWQVFTSTGNTNDTVLGGTSADIIRAGAGNDVIRAGDGHDEVYGMDGDDIIHGGGGSDYDLDGGAGNDWIHARDGAENYRITGGSGIDTACVDSKDLGIETVETLQAVCTRPAGA